ncbi:cysteine hydrolase family protein [Actinacidiphila yeochonensis]|uniref:cysteine hydrolase family protein n=1 Tax=Actinacidiphila yeochonensis TaxID=89050 RepID=UPI000559F609|nr:cysteine hydrolase family protein [Actinacidiphila yeochonensis]
MSTLEGRTGTALLVVDVQNDVVAKAYRRDEVVAAIAGLVERARRAEVPVVWVRHADEELVKGASGWQIVPELVPAGAEPVVEKEYGDSFEATELEELLSGFGVGRLVVAGAATDVCIRSTVHGAFTRGYDTTLVSDGHTTEDLSAWGAPPPEQVIAHTNLYWSNQSAPGRTAAVSRAAEVDFTAGA